MIDDPRVQGPPEAQEEDPVIIDLDNCYGILALARVELWEAIAETDKIDEVITLAQEIRTLHQAETIIAEVIDPREEESDATVRPTGDPGHSSSQGCS